ncbi:NlpC/P60 family protein [Syntrophomonas curvata]
MKKIVAVMFLAFLFLQTTSSDLMAQELQYQVKAGDCLWTIAQSHGISIDYLRKVNNLQSDSIQIGDMLNVGNGNPAMATPSRGTETGLEAGCYTVKAGDSLYQIALNHGITVEMLKQTNNLSSTMIYPGQKLLISIRQAVPSRAGTIVSADLVLAKAAEHLGTPYKYGGQGPGGFDCSGFVSYIFGQFGYKLPHNAAGQANLGIAVNKDELLPGDLVFFDGNTSHINHVGIYSGNAQFIHSSSPRSGGVIYSSLNEAYYASGYVSARRIIR